MSQPYIGEIRLLAFNFDPAGWAACDGRLLPISEHDALFTLLGTTFGGDGQETFALPDLRGRVPVHMGQGPGLSARVLGELGGVEAVTLTSQQIPAHSHALLATTAGATSTSPAGRMPAAVSGDTFYVTTPTGNTAALMSAQALAAGGGSQPHENCMPTLTMQYCISLYGIYPQQN
ncbi:phage tail protein [Lysobacter humi (ex Lee et al. 2017)]